MEREGGGVAMHCMKCGRALKRPSDTGYGPRCQVAVLGRKPRAPKREDRRSADARQQELPL